MKLSRMVFAVLVSTGMFLGPANVASAAGPTSAEGSTCRAGIPQTAPETDRYYQGEPAFGPAELPRRPPAGPLLFDYERFGDLTEAEFLARYRSGGNYIFPAQDGFLIENGQPVRYPKELRPGVRVDRFGFPGGSFLAPVDTPFAERSLSPQSLNTPAGTPESNYHVYCVLRPFTVAAGPIAPWFGQPGLGVQYKLDLAYLPEAGTNLSVTWLLANGYLVEEEPAHHHLLATGVAPDRATDLDGRTGDDADEPGPFGRGADEAAWDASEPTDWDDAFEPVGRADAAGPADREPVGSRD